MNKITLLFLALVSFTLTGCTDVESRLDNEEWTFQRIVGGVVVDSGTAKFEKDGTGTFNEDAFTWSVNSEEVLSIIENGIETRMTSTKNERKHQIYTYTTILNIAGSLELSR